MEVIDFFVGDNKDYWLAEIQKSDWGAGKYLYELLRDHKLKELCGESTKVLLLVDNGELLSFCTYAEQDDVREPSLTPWVGFVYTFPKNRGKRRMGKLLEYAYALAKNDGYKHIYISTGETGIYEKYGYTFWKMMKDIGGEDSRVYRIDVVTMNYGDVLGTSVSGTIDRPLGSYKYTEARPTKGNILDDMKATPPGTDLSNKYYFGFFDNQKLIAIMDLIDGYPKPEIAYIGFL